MPNQINGQQFRIKNCKDSYLYVFDFVNTVTVDNCSNCTIVFGAVKTSYHPSIFIRYCNDCVILAACQQFRVRDSKNITAFIAAVSEPIIETSSSINFAPFQLSYPQLNVQFRAAGLNQFNCSYSSVHDFSARGSTPRNYDFLEPSACIKDHVLLPQHLDPTGRALSGGDILQRLKSLQVSLDPVLSIVPPTYSGLLINPAPEGAFSLLGLFFHIGVEKNARLIIKYLYGLSSKIKFIARSSAVLNNSYIYLVRSRCLQYSREDITRIFGDSTLAQHSELASLPIHSLGLSLKFIMKPKLVMQLYPILQLTTVFQLLAIVGIPNSFRTYLIPGVVKSSKSCQKSTMGLSWWKLESIAVCHSTLRMCTDQYRTCDPGARPVIMLQFYGSPGIAVGQICQGIVDELVESEHIKPPTLIHVTQDSAIASRQADMIAHFPVCRA
ncbi:hypothetical protein ACTXT7_006253 [Hymenolepis weldensis]